MLLPTMKRKCNVQDSQGAQQAKLAEVRDVVLIPLRVSPPDQSEKGLNLKHSTPEHTSGLQPLCRLTIWAQGHAERRQLPRQALRSRRNCYGDKEGRCRETWAEYTLTSIIVGFVHGFSKMGVLMLRGRMFLHTLT